MTNESTRNEPTYALLRRSPETAEHVQDILGLSTNRWTDVHVQLRTGEVATAEVTFILTTDQLRQLVDLMDQCR